MSDHSSQYARDVLEQRWDDLQETVEGFERTYAKNPNEWQRQDIYRMKALQRELLIAMRCLHRELG
jgi:hypothetical protein